MEYKIGDIVKDENGITGIVCIKYNDGELCVLENDYLHPNPRKVFVAGEGLEE